MNWIGGHTEAEELSPEHPARPSDHDSDVGLPPGGKGSHSRAASRRQVCG